MDVGACPMEGLRLGFAAPQAFTGPLPGYSGGASTRVQPHTRCRSLAYSVNCQQALATWQTVVQYPTQNPLQQRTIRDYRVCICVSLPGSFYRRPGLLYLSSGNPFEFCICHQSQRSTSASASASVSDAIALFICICTNPGIAVVPVVLVALAIGRYSCATTHDHQLPLATAAAPSPPVARGRQQLFTIVSTLWRIARLGLAFPIYYSLLFSFQPVQPVVPVHSQITPPTGTDSWNPLNPDQETKSQAPSPSFSRLPIGILAIHGWLHCSIRSQWPLASCGFSGFRICRR